MKELTRYEKHFNVFVKGIEDPIEISHEGGEKLQIILESKDCPPFVRINGNSYSRFEILRLIYVKEFVPEPFDDHAEEIKAFDELRKLKNLEIGK